METRGATRADSTGHGISTPQNGLLWCRKARDCRAQEQAAMRQAKSGLRPYDHMHVARSACCVIVGLVGRVHVSSCPCQQPCVSCNDVDMPTFILGLCSTLCAAHQTEFWVAPWRLAQVIYFRHAAAFRQATFLLLHTTRLVLRLLLLLQRPFSGPLPFVLPGPAPEIAQYAF